MSGTLSAQTAWVFIGFPTSGKEPAKKRSATWEHFCARPNSETFSTRRLLKTGHPVAEICAVAERRSVDLIITATHGHTGLAHLLIGSVAEQVVRRANQSVLVVPSHPEARAQGLKKFVRGENQTRSRSIQRLISAPQLTRSARTLMV